MTDRWRYRCPEGHTTIQRYVTQDGYFCRTCAREYSGDPVDLRQEQPDASGGWHAETAHQHASAGRDHR